MLRFKIHIRNHGLTVKALFRNDVNLLIAFNSHFQTWKSTYNTRMRRSVKTPDKNYVLILKDGSYGYHKNLYPKLLQLFKDNNIPPEEIETSYLLPYKAAPNNVQLSDSLKLRDHQPKVIDFICSKEGILANVVVIPLQTGMGKTLTSLYSISRLKERASLTMSARYMQSWIDDIAKFYKGDSSQYKIVKKGSELKLLIDDALNDKIRHLNLIIFSIDILRDYFKEFELTGKSTYGCNPEDLYKVLGVGIRFTDEAHENIHFNFVHDINTHVNKSVYLSATIESHEHFTNELYAILFPINARLQGLKWNKYIIGTALGYKLRHPKRVKCMGAQGYSHTEYEKYIMLSKELTEHYFRMCMFFMEKGFVQKYQPKQKLLVYFSTIDMCNLFTEYVKSHISNKSLKISSFVEADEADTLVENDVLMSTPGKSGTGRNIIGLVTVISTIAIKSMQSNTQTSGRLRDIREMFPGVDANFYYLVCTDIKKHMDYHNLRLELFKNQFSRLMVYNTQWEV